jgi:hypothetical protein
MAGEPSRESGHDPIESLIDDVIRDILNEAGASTKAAVRGMTPAAALIETAMATPRGAMRTSMLERVLVAEAFATVLADALAPALAEALAPKIIKALEHSTTGEFPGKESVSTASAAERGREAETE